VRRDGLVSDVDASQLVPGDIVLLEAGDRVPADGRLLAAHNLEAEEAALTGESHAVGKHVAALASDNLPLGERLNLLLMNPVLTRSRAELLITETGMRSEMGKLAGMIAAAPEGNTPLQRQLDTLGKKLAAIAGGVVTIIFLVDSVRGQAWTEAAMTAVALAVAGIPEGLPAVVTIMLAIGMWRMARNRAILKKLSAVETLGSTKVICSDKTDTLTLNQMTARAGWFAGNGFSVSGEGYLAEGSLRAPPGLDLRPLLLPMALCTDSRVRNGQLIGDPTEGALWVLAEKGGLAPEAELQDRPRLAEIPFDSAHKFMATFHDAGETVEVLVKGAPDVLLARASRWLSANGEQAPDAASRHLIESRNDDLAAQARRVLAVARRSIPSQEFDPAGDLMAWASEWTFRGLAGLMDPPRPEAKAAIALCHQAAVQVRMITGDHKATAAAIARELGLAGDVLSGAELDSLDDAALATRINDIAVFARVSPTHKVRIVRALKAVGHVVAMTGDGVNDAPALKASGIGVAMGITGTAVTREAVTLVLPDDNFATIVRAVEEGRDLRQHRQVRALPAIDQHRRDPDRADRHTARLAGAFHGHPPAVDQHHHGWPAGDDAGRRTRTPRPDARPAAIASGAYPEQRPLAASGVLWPDDDGRHPVHVPPWARRARPEVRTDAGLHHLCAVSVLQCLQRPRRAGQPLQRRLLCQRQALAGACRRARAAGGGRALGPGAEHLRYRRSEPARLGTGGGGDGPVSRRSAQVPGKTFPRPRQWTIMAGMETCREPENNRSTASRLTGTNVSRIMGGTNERPGNRY
jgi:phosphoserine phosphatase